MDLLVGSIVSVAVVDEDVEAVPLRPHVDEEGDGVAHVDRPGDPVARQTVARPDLHEALGRGESEDHGVSRVSSGQAEMLELEQQHEKHKKSSLLDAQMILRYEVEERKGEER